MHRAFILSLAILAVASGCTTTDADPAHPWKSPSNSEIGIPTNDARPLKARLASKTLGIGVAKKNFC
jgi:hypothetical protein